jgi:Mrp family chromosome partitioning ATPase
MGMVSDTFSLAEIADLTIIVVRHNKTINDALKSTINEAKANGITGMSILLNDISREQSFYGYTGRYGYGYGYGRKYGNE